MTISLQLICCILRKITELYILLLFSKNLLKGEVFLIFIHFPTLVHVQNALEDVKLHNFPTTLLRNVADLTKVCSGRLGEDGHSLYKRITVMNSLLLYTTPLLNNRAINFYGTKYILYFVPWRKKK